MIENSVVSLPPCWVALEVKAPPTLPCSAPVAQRPPACSKKLPSAEGHAAEPGRRADDDRVVVRQILDLGDGRRLVELEMRGLGDLLRDDLRDALDVDRRARGPGAFRFGVGQRLDVAVGRIIENKHLGHRGVSRSCRSSDSEHFRHLVEGEARAAREELGVVAVADVDQHVRLGLAVGEEFRVDFGVVEAGHRARVEAERPAARE